MKEIEGNLSATGMRFGIIVGRFNDFIGTALLNGAIDCIVRHQGDKENITVVRVPGAYEIPVAAQKMASRGSYDAIICLGAVIRGATPHFDVVAHESAKGIAQVALQHGLPITNGILTTDSIEQAIERAGTKAGNKGWDAAASAIEMVNVFKQL